MLDMVGVGGVWGWVLVIQRPRCGDIDAIAERTFCGTLYNIEFGKNEKMVNLQICFSI